MKKDVVVTVAGSALRMPSEKVSAMEKMMAIR